MRTFKGKKLSKLAEICHPEKITLDLFIHKLIDDLQHFSFNIDLDEDKYPEEWMEMLLAWAEYNTETDDEDSSD